jgi:hypothetical protein
LVEGFDHLYMEQDIHQNKQNDSSENPTTYDIHNLENPKNDIIANIFNDKLELIKGKINDLLKLIDERLKVKTQVLSNLENEILRAKNIILEKSPRSAYSLLVIDPICRDLEKEIFRIEKTKIEEEITAWNDVLQLKRDIVDLENELSNATNKSKLIENGNY